MISNKNGEMGTMAPSSTGQSFLQQLFKRHPRDDGMEETMEDWVEEQEKPYIAPPKPRGTSRLCKGTVLKGEICAEENLVIDGRMDGPVKSDGDVIVSGKVTGNIQCGHKCSVMQGGEVIGNITCKSVEISGTVHGDLTVQDGVVLLDNAVMEGNITAACIRTAAKARVHGLLDIGERVGALQAALAEQNDSHGEAADILQGNKQKKAELAPQDA